jgi:hypothetical protein
MLNSIFRIFFTNNRRQNERRVCNSRTARTLSIHLIGYVTKLSNLTLKIEPKQLLQSLPLYFTLSNTFHHSLYQTYTHTHTHTQTITLSVCLSYTHTHSHTLYQTQTHSHTLYQTHTHTHSQTHPHTPLNLSPTRCKKKQNWTKNNNNEFERTQIIAPLKVFFN